MQSNGEEDFQEVVLGPKKITILEIRQTANTLYDNKCKTKIQQYRSLCQILEKEEYEVNLYPVIDGMKYSKLYCAI